MRPQLAVHEHCDVEGVLRRQHRITEIRPERHVGTNEFGGGDAARHAGAVIITLRPPERRKLKSAALLDRFGDVKPLALSVGLMAGRALSLKYLGAMSRV